MNKVIEIGRMTRDPEVKYGGPNNTAISRFTLAVDRRFKRDGDEQTADFISCVAFGKTAEFIEKYGRKGTKFAVEGRIQTGSYTNSDGNKVYTTDVVVEQIEFAESKNNSSDLNVSDLSQPTNDPGDFMNIGDDEMESLPFN